MLKSPIHRSFAGFSIIEEPADCFGSPSKVGLLFRYVCWCSVLIGGILSSSPDAQAQVSPDGSLGQETSIVAPDVLNEIPIQRITGGATRDQAVFHSFQIFNIAPHQSVYFAPPDEVNFIFSRVTGGGASTIDGTLGVLGPADLFFLNPHGIIFGSEARLDVNGSFLASTAEGLVFDSAFIFSAADPQAPPLLTLSVPVGLQFGSDPAPLVLQDDSNLDVPAQETLALVGGEVLIEGGELNAQGGRIELGSVDGPDVLTWAPDPLGWRLTYEDVSQLGDVVLAETAVVDVSSPDPSLSSGSVQIQAGQVILRDQARILALNLAESVVGGQLHIQAENAVVVSDDAGIFSTSVLGPGGDITIMTPSLTLKGMNAAIQAATTGAAVGGDLTIQVSELGVDGQGGLALISTQTFADGAAGQLKIQTDRLQVEDGGRITSSVENGTGNGGALTINAVESITLKGEGATETGSFPSGIISESDGSSATGDGGTIQIQTGSLRIEEGATISSATVDGSQGAAGTISIEAGSLQLDQQASLNASTRAGSGNIVIQAEQLILQGNSTIRTNAVGDASGGNITVEAEVLLGLENSDITANAFAGQGGQIRITTQALLGFETRTRQEIETLLGSDDPNDLDPAQLPTSDITSFTQDPTAAVTVEQDLIELQDPDVDPLQGLVDLPAPLTSVEELVPGACPAVEGNSFSIIGRGGLPLDPRYPLLSEVIWRDPRPGSEASQTQAKDLIIQGIERLSLGQPETALRLWRQAERIYQTAGDERGQWGSQLNQIQALRELGLMHQVRVQLERMAPYLEDPIDLELQIKTLHHRGLTLYQSRDHQQAESILRSSLAFAQQAGLLADQIGILIDLGHVARAQDRQQQAQDYYQQAASLAQTAQDNRLLDLLLRARTSQLDLWVDQDKKQAALSLWTELIQLIQDRPPNRTQIHVRIHSAEAMLHLLQSDLSQNNSLVTEDPESILIQQLMDWLNRTAQQATASQNLRAESYALGQLGRLYELRQDYSLAKSITQQALLQANQIAADDIAVNWQWQLGRIRSQQGFRTEAIAAYEEAITTLAGLRADLVAANPEIQFSFREQVEPVYRQLVDLLLQDPEPTQSQLVRSRALIESLQLAELDNFFQDACTQPEPVVIDDLDPTAAIIYPILLPDRLEVIAKLPGTDSLYHHRVPEITREQIQQTVTDLQTALRRRSTPLNQLELPAQQLYRWLIGPLAAPLESIQGSNQVQTLVFVSDGILRNVPMSVLHDGERYLVERYPIAVAPSLQLVDPQPLQGRDFQILMAGSENAPSFQQEGLGSLPFVTTEIERIQQISDQNQILLNDAFLRPNLQQALRIDPVTVLHLATHGSFSSDPEETFILDWQDRISAQDLDTLLAERDMNGESPIDLLVLSACETAIGDDRAALGLAGVATRAGASSTVGSLWTINDASTAEFMSRFYQELAQPQVSKAVALRRAQLSFLADYPETDYSRPYHWAAFILVGNWL